MNSHSLRITCYALESIAAKFCSVRDFFVCFCFGQSFFCLQQLFCQLLFSSSLLTFLLKKKKKEIKRILKPINLKTNAKCWISLLSQLRCWNLQSWRKDWNTLMLTNFQRVYQRRRETVVGTFRRWAVWRGESSDSSSQPSAMPADSGWTSCISSTGRRGTGTPEKGGYNTLPDLKTFFFKIMW